MKKVRPEIDRKFNFLSICGLTFFVSIKLINRSGIKVLYCWW